MAGDPQGRRLLGVRGTFGGSTRVESGQHLREIRRRAAALAHDLWGRGPERCEVHWAGPEMLVTLFYGGLTPAEMSLEEAGAITEVERSRENFRRTLEPHLRDLVEEVTGRSADAAVGASQIGPDLTIEVFILGPAASEPAADSLASRIRAADRDTRAIRTNAETEVQAASAVTEEAAQARRQARQIRSESRRARREDLDQPPK